MLGYGVALFAFPKAAATWWPWPLTPLTARAIAAWLLGLGIVLAQANVENDWRRIRAATLPYAGLAVLEAIALLRFRHTLDWGAAGPWLMVLFLATVLFLGLVGWAASTRSTEVPAAYPASP